jgi:hypothetical protein
MKPLFLNTTSLFGLLQQALLLSLTTCLFFQTEASFFFRTKTSFCFGSMACFFFGFAVGLFFSLATGVLLFQARFSFSAAASLKLDTPALFFLSLLQRCDFRLDLLLFLGSFTGRLLSLFSNRL